MIEVKDEILNGKPLYRVRDKDGNILFDNLTIEMITEILQEGTPINKELFKTIESEINNALALKYYNVPEYTIEYIEKKYRTEDNLSYIPNMTRDAMRGFKITAKEISYNDTYVILNYKGSRSSAEKYLKLENTDTNYIKIKLDKPIYIEELEIYAKSYSTSSVINIETSLDDVTYESAYTIMPDYTGAKSYILTDKSTFAQYIKIYFSNTDVETTYFTVWNIYIHETKEPINVLTFDFPLIEKVNERIFIETPENLSTDKENKLIFSNLKSYEIPFLKPKTKYELVYDGEKICVFSEIENNSMQADYLSIPQNINEWDYYGNPYDNTGTSSAASAFSFSQLGKWLAIVTASLYGSSVGNKGAAKFLIYDNNDSLKGAKNSFFEIKNENLLICPEIIKANGIGIGNRLYGVLPDGTEEEITNMLHTYPDADSSSNIHYYLLAIKKYYSSLKVKFSSDTSGIYNIMPIKFLYKYR